MSGDPAAVARAVAELGSLAQVGAPLGARTTYRVGGPAAVLVECGSLDDLRRAGAAHRVSGLPTLVVGRGSNLLVADAGFHGIAVVLGPAFEQVAVTGTAVVAGGAASLPVVARRTAAAGLTGFEWAVGVPGSMGGAVRMNAGGHGSDLASSLVRVHRLDLATGDDGDVAAADLDLGYRRSNVAPHHVVTEAELALAPGDTAVASAAVSEIVRWRRAHQPGGQNAGSVFTNPSDDAAGRLVEAAGCRGLRRGSAEVSPKHANFVQADPGGSADDVAALVAEVADRVEASSGVRLRTEVRFIGFGHDDAAPQVEVEG